MDNEGGRTPRALRAAKRGQQREKKERKRQRLAASSNGNTTPDAKYASPAAPHGSPDLVGFADPTTYGSPPVSAVPVGDVSNSEAFAAAVATGDGGADLTTLRPVESPDEVHTPSSNAPAKPKPSGAGTMGNTGLDTSIPMFAAPAAATDPQVFPGDLPTAGSTALHPEPPVVGATSAVDEGRPSPD